MNKTDWDAPDFGRKIGEFKANTSNLALPLAGGLLLALLGIGRFVQAINAQGERDLFGILLAVMFFYFSAILLFIAFGRYQARQTRYMLYERGLQRVDGTEASAIGWDQVRRVRREGHRLAPGAGNKPGDPKRWKNMQLIGLAGQSLTISNQQRLAGMVLGMLLVHHWPIIQGEIDAGGKIYLCRLVVSQEGLEYRGRMVPWSRIKKAHTSGHLRLDTVSGRISWPEINDEDTNDVLGYALLQRAVGYYAGRE